MVGAKLLVGLLAMLGFLGTFVSSFAVLLACAGAYTMAASHHFSRGLVMLCVGLLTAVVAWLVTGWASAAVVQRSLGSRET